jgi:hypothetical protein
MMPRNVAAQDRLDQAAPAFKRRRIGRLISKDVRKTHRKFKVTMDSRHNLSIATNHFDRQFTKQNRWIMECG